MQGDAGRAERHGRVTGVGGNLVAVEMERPVIQNEVARLFLETGAGPLSLKAEVIRVRGRQVDVQVFEETDGLRVGARVHFTGELLSAELGPGLLGQVFDGLQHPLESIADLHGHFLARGAYPRALDAARRWAFTPLAKPGDRLLAGMPLGWVPESIFRHWIMVPFGCQGRWTVAEVASPGELALDDVAARLEGPDGQAVDVRLSQRWPVKIPPRAHAKRLLPVETMVTRIRAIDTLSPVARGGVYCIPGPFGAGKTVIQQLTSKHAEVDVVVLAACGERAGEVVETIRTFPEMEDPRTGRSLMERTVIVCNTSSMPVAAREASVQTAACMAEYYRQMGLHVLLLADSTSRWAQALREMSGRLEEIPGEEAFPASLESVIAAFYERAGLVRLHTGETASLTIGGSVSPAGGNFEEPVTQATLKVVGAFLGLSRSRADARKYPAIDPLESWSRYPGVTDGALARRARDLLRQGDDIGRMMQVVGEEGASAEEHVIWCKAEFLDAAYLQQDAFDPVDGATPAPRQRHVFGALMELLAADMSFPSRDAARSFFQELTQMALDWHRIPWDDPAFARQEAALRQRCRMAACGGETPREAGHA